MCPSGNPRIPASQTQGNREFVVPAGQTSSTLRVDAVLRYRKIDQFLLNYVMGEKAGLTAPVVDIASATATVCVRRAGAEAACQ
jgi:hypothetical protein